MAKVIHLLLSGATATSSEVSAAAHTRSGGNFGAFGDTGHISGDGAGGGNSCASWRGTGYGRGDGSAAPLGRWFWRRFPAGGGGGGIWPR